MNKSTATEKDLVLIYFEDNPLSFARIESISPDSKPEWYHVTLLLLQVPIQLVTWILRDIYIDGSEFTMNGKRMRLEKVVVPDKPEDADVNGEEKETGKPANASGKAKVISLKDINKK
jgi:hypothetical protein